MMLLDSLFKSKIKNIHFIGIGGIGMSGIARVLIGHGFSISGSDLKESEEILSLKKLGAKIFIGHNKDNLKSVDVVVYSSAISKDNPELIFAKENHIPIIPRAMMLAELMKLRLGIAITGAHGKTTTTSIIGSLMHELGFDPSVIIGGVVNRFLSNAYLGEGPYLVAEADESDGSFLHLTPSIAVITNIDEEHLDYYQGGLSEIVEKFLQFSLNLPFYGLLVASYDDAIVRKLLLKVNRRIKTYGFHEDANFRAVNIKSDGFQTTFDLLVNGKYQETFITKLSGFHNVQNCLAAICVLDELQVDFKHLVPALKSFCGVKRRFSLIGEINGIKVIDDYAHHPNEIKAVINASKMAFPNSKIKILFQPHRYSRTKNLYKDFYNCFLKADEVIFTDIYAASEEPILNITSQNLVTDIKNNTNISIHYASSIENGIEKLIDLTNKNDILLTMGAGNITMAAPKIVDLLNKKYSE